MEPLTAVLLMLFAFVVLALFIARTDGLGFMAPRSTAGIRVSAASFCTDQCRKEGRCPLTGTTAQAATCPLWGFVRADVPTAVYGSPFREGME